MDVFTLTYVPRLIEKEIQVCLTGYIERKAKLININKTRKNKKF